MYLEKLIVPPENLVSTRNLVLFTISKDSNVLQNIRNEISFE